MIVKIINNDCENNNKFERISLAVKREAKEAKNKETDTETE